jgi:O-antigen ligase
MQPYRYISTLPFLCILVFGGLALSNENFVLGIGSFKLSVIDTMFLCILLAKGLRTADPAAYTLPPARILILLAINFIVISYLLITASPSPGIYSSDVVRDLRIIFYFVMLPYLCYKDIDSSNAYRQLQWAIVASGITVSVLMLGKQVVGFSTVEPVRDVSLGVWVLPMSITSLLYFRETLGLKPRNAYLLMMIMIVALVFSLNRSQYLQLAITAGIAVMLGGRVGAMRKAFQLFAPAIIGGLLLFYAIGYLEVLTARILTVETLKEEDSSYGARVEEYEGQMLFFAEKPLFGHGPGFRSWVMGEDGFELSTFAHNSWAFYLMKFGLVGTIIIMAPCLLLLLLSLGRHYADPTLEMHRRYMIACAPVYIFIDSMSGGLSYAPKSAFTGFLLCYCLSLLRNDCAPLKSVESTLSPRNFSPMIAEHKLGASSLPRLSHHG